MQVPSPRSIALEAALSLQHMERIVTAVESTAGARQKGITQCALIWIRDESLLPSARQALSLYQKVRARISMAVDMLAPNGLDR